MPKNKMTKQRHIAQILAKAIGAIAIISPLIFAIPLSIGAELASPSLPPSSSIPQQTSLSPTPSSSVPQQTSLSPSGSVIPSPSPSLLSSVLVAQSASPSPSGSVYEPPVIINPIQSQITSQLAGQTLQVGDSLTIQLHDIFEDADLLDYHIIVQNPNVAGVTIDNETGTLIISMNKKGTTMVTLTAKYKNQPAIQLERFRITGDTPSTLDSNNDNKIRVDEIVKYMNDQPGKNANDYKSLLNTVKPNIPQANLAPVVRWHGAITEFDVRLNGWIGLSLDEVFGDEDGDLLTYTFESPLLSSGSNVTASIDSSNILKIKGHSLSSQAAMITVKADDQQSTPTSTVTHQFRIKVNSMVEIQDIGLVDHTYGLEILSKPSIILLKD